MLNLSPHSVLGIDISDLSIKIIQLDKKKGNLRLVSFLKEKIPAGIVDDGVIVDEDKLAEALKRSFKNIKGESLLNKEAICNLPEEKVFIRIIQLPKMKKEEIEQAVRFETEAHIPLSINEVYLSWEAINSTNDQSKTNVLIAVAQHKLIDSYVRVFKKSGLRLIALEPESLGVIRSLVKSNDLKPTIILDLGATGTNFVIFSGGAIRFTSQVSISGQDFNKAIMKDLKVDQKEADKLKIKVGLDSSKKEVYKSLEPIVNKLAIHVQEYINFYHQHSDSSVEKDKQINQVLLCGGDSLLINLPSFMESKLGIPVKLGDPLINLSCSPKDLSAVKKESFSKKRALVYATAIGLALRNF